MYIVSNEFKNAMLSPAQEHRLTGTIGNISFDESNIVEGSFQITNQSTDTNDVVLGSCYVGQLTAEFVGINIAYGKWINKTITPSFGLKVGEYYEYVPMGVYKVKEAKHTDHGVQVTAYDNMIKFDRKFVKSHFMNLSGMTNIIDQLCTDAGVVCGMSHAQIEALPNGDRTGINIYGSTGKKAEFANDITTLRDLLFWVAQTLGCFATINRAGQLEFRPYNQNVVDKITEQHRIAGATFADYVTHYVGIYVENLDDNTEDYYGYDSTALQQELTETMAEITQDQENITDLELDRADWVQKLANHECTQEEYDAAIAEIDAQEKALTKEINQLSKRAEWLSNAIAQSADDGSDMVLGANPLVMAKNLTTRDQQRREILGALDAISYTPFQASVVCGCIYDLGDVIQFSGGLYNSDTDSFGCVMSYTYTHNGGTELEGFGVDPSVVVVRNKSQKAAYRSNGNAIDAARVTVNTDDPKHPATLDDTVLGKQGDMYVQVNKDITPKHTISFLNEYYTCEGKYKLYSDIFKPQKIEYSKETGKYNIYFAGLIYSSGRWMGEECYLWGGNYRGGEFLLRVHGFTRAGTYEVSLDASYSCEGESPVTGTHIGFELTYTNSVSDSAAPGWQTTSYGFSKQTSGSKEYLILNLEPDDETHTYTGSFNLPEEYVPQDGILYLWISRMRMVDDGWHTSQQGTMQFSNFYFKYSEDEKYYNESNYVGDMYVYSEDYTIDDEYTTPATRSEPLTDNNWHKIKRISEADESQHSGLAVSGGRNVLKLTPEVMRAWYKADPPQIERNFSQFCVRYTGEPDASIAIEPYGGVEWANVSCKQADDGAFTLKCGGTKTTGTVAYYAYKITGLVSGEKYYFNFAADFGANADIGGNTNKSLGVLFNTTGTVSSDDYSGEPHTFDDETLYESFYRNNTKHYYDFGFEATASTMYMCVVLGDLNACTTQLSIKALVISKTERKYIRKFYLYDTTEKAWLEYRPFGAGDDGGVITIDALSDLTDVSLDNLQNGQILKWNRTTHKWENANESGGGASSLDTLSDVDIDAQTLSDGQVLKYDSENNEWINADDESGVQAIELTQAQYDALSAAEKADAKKVYYIKDAPSSDLDIDDLQNVNITSPLNGQVLKYNSSTSKWENANESNSVGYDYEYYEDSINYRQYIAAGADFGFGYTLNKANIKSSFVGKTILYQGARISIEYNGDTYYLPTIVNRCVNYVDNGVETVILEISAINTQNFDFDPLSTQSGYLPISITITFVGIG